MLEDNGQSSEYHRIWESLIFPKNYYLESQLFYSPSPMIFFVISGSLSLRINNVEEHIVYSQEMFMAQSDNSYGITMLEQTHLLICYVPMEAWFIEQKWIDELVKDENNAGDEFFKLSIKKIITHYLSLLDMYLKEAICPPDFYELKRQELFFLFFYYYKERELARFLQSILSKDIQFKKFVVNNYLYVKNVQEMAKSANYSTSGFIKKFQKCFNDSPYKWMQKQKAKHISLEINRGVKSLQEIANEYKFSSYQHFSVFCKTKLGSPPSKVLLKKKETNMVNKKMER